MAEAPGIILLGAGGHALVVAETLALCGRQVLGHVALADAGDPRLGRYLGGDDAVAELLERDAEFVCAMGSVSRATINLRQKLCALLPEARAATVIHPSAQVSASARLAPGVFVGALAVIGPDARIGAHGLINTGAIVEHECEIGRATHCASGALLAGAVTVGEDCLIGARSVIRQGCKIGDAAIVGGGAVVLRDVNVAATVIGTPARPVSDRAT